MLKVGEADNYHPGFGRIVQMLDHFRISGPLGVHICIALEVMKLSVENLRNNNPDRVERFPLPAPIVRQMARDVLTGLSYLHDKCRLVHTGEAPCGWSRSGN